MIFYRPTLGFLTFTMGAVCQTSALKQFIEVQIPTNGNNCTATTCATDFDFSGSSGGEQFFTDPGQYRDGFPREVFGHDTSSTHFNPRRRQLNTGALNNWVILVRFPEHAHHGNIVTERVLPTVSDYEIFFNSKTSHSRLAPAGSVYNVWEQASYGQLELTSVISDWVTVERSQKDYTADRSTETRLDRNLILEAITLAVTRDYPGEDGSSEFRRLFDQNSDGFIDVFTVLHSGFNEEECGFDETDRFMWPCMYMIPSHYSDIIPNVRVHGMNIEKYHITSGVSFNSWTIAPVGPVSHEIGHFFGLPDLYGYGGNSYGWGIGTFGLMGDAHGVDGSSQFPPVLSAWSKMELDYMEPYSIVTNPLLGVEGVSVIQMRPTNSFESRPNQVIKLDEEAGFADGEYLLVELREEIGFDALLGDEGVLIWHIDENRNHYKVALIQDDFFGPGDCVAHSNGGEEEPNTDSYHNGETHIKIEYLGNGRVRITYNDHYGCDVDSCTNQEVEKLHNQPDDVVKYRDSYIGNSRSLRCCSCAMTSRDDLDETHLCVSPVGSDSCDAHCQDKQTEGYTYESAPLQDFYGTRMASKCPEIAPYGDRFFGWKVMQCDCVEDWEDFTDLFETGLLTPDHTTPMGELESYFGSESFDNLFAYLQYLMVYLCLDMDQLPDYMEGEQANIEDVEGELEDFADTAASHGYSEGIKSDPEEDFDVSGLHKAIHRDYFKYRMVPVNPGELDEALAFMIIDHVPWERMMEIDGSEYSDDGLAWKCDMIVTIQSLVEATDGMDIDEMVCTVYEELIRPSSEDVNGDDPGDCTLWNGFEFEQKKIWVSVEEGTRASTFAAEYLWEKAHENEPDDGDSLFLKIETEIDRAMYWCNAIRLVQPLPEGNLRVGNLVYYLIAKHAVMNNEDKTSMRNHSRDKRIRFPEIGGDLLANNVDLDQFALFHYRTNF